MYSTSYVTPLWRLVIDVALAIIGFLAAWQIDILSKGVPVPARRRLAQSLIVAGAGELVLALGHLLYLEGYPLYGSMRYVAGGLVLVSIVLFVSSLLLRRQGRRSVDS